MCYIVYIAKVTLFKVTVCNVTLDRRGTLLLSVLQYSTICHTSTKVWPFWTHYMHMATPKLNDSNSYHVHVHEHAHVHARVCELGHHVHTILCSY